MQNTLERIKEVTHINPSNTKLGEKFTQMEPDSITIEEGDLIYALVRMRKPNLVIETGTGHACATHRIVDALVANGEGHLLSCDTDEEYVDAAQLEIPSSFVIVRNVSGLALLSNLNGVQAEVILVDAGNADNRMEELKFIVKHNVLTDKGILIIHDAVSEKYLPLAAYIKAEGWLGIIMDSLAGIAVFQKP